MNNKTKIERPSGHFSSISRRDALKYIGTAGAMAALPFPWLSQANAASTHTSKGVNLQRLGVEYPDWIREARIYGFPIDGLKVDPYALNKSLDSVAHQGANVVEADTRLSDFITGASFDKEIKLITDSVRLIHERGMKVVWYIPALEMITPNGRLRNDTIARKHPEWLQLSFDGKQRGVFYGRKVFWVEPDDESAWMCPNSPYREWFHARLARIAATGVDGLWLDVPLFGLVVGKWGCACNYCQDKFTLQTGMEFPKKFDLTDKRFWQFIQWRHRTLTEFVESCRQVIAKANPDTVTIAEVVSLDHIGATVWGTEGNQMSSHYVVWEQDGASEATGMADASYDDWIAQYGSYKYCRGATMDRPSWAFSYGFNDPDAQLVMAGAIAAQNNPYELRTPKMTTSVGISFRGMMFNWIADYSKLIFHSRSLASVAIIYSSRNRDFLDATHSGGGLIVSGDSNHRDRRWLGTKTGSPLYQEYMGDYRGLSLLLYQNQIPTDIYPINRVDEQLLRDYPVLVLPYMAVLGEIEKALLLSAVRAGSTLIVSGPKPGQWDLDGSKRETGLWADLLPDNIDEPTTIAVGKGRICFWRDEVGRNYLRSHSAKVTKPILGWLAQAGIGPWTSKQQKVVVQPYVYNNQTVIHVLNYEWTGTIKSKPSTVQVNLSIPWVAGKNIVSVVQSEPQWQTEKTLAYSFQGNKLLIPVTVGINSLVIINS